MAKNRPTNKLVIAGVITVLIVAALLLFRGCGAIVGDGGSAGGVGDTIPAPPDTIYINMPPDTVYTVDTIRVVVYKPIPNETYIDTSDKYLGAIDCDSTRLYINNILDSAGSVSVTSKVKGKMLEQDVSMQVKTITITDVDTVRIEIPCPDPIKQKAVWTIGGAFNSAIQPIVWATVQNNNRSLMAGYNFVDGRIMLGAGISLGGK